MRVGSLPSLLVSLLPTCGRGHRAGPLSLPSASRRLQRLHPSLSGPRHWSLHPCRQPAGVPGECSFLSNTCILLHCSWPLEPRTRGLRGTLGARTSTAQGRQLCPAPVAAEGLPSQMHTCPRCVEPPRPPQAPRPSRWARLLSLSLHLAPLPWAGSLGGPRRAFRTCSPYGTMDARGLVGSSGWGHGRLLACSLHAVGGTAPLIGWAGRDPKVLLPVMPALGLVNPM